MIIQEVSWIRSNIDKFSPSLRKQALEWYRPFRFVPCFLQKLFKGVRKHFRRLPVIVQIRPQEEFALSVLALLDRTHCKNQRELALIHSFSTKVNAKKLEYLIKDDAVVRIWYDEKVKTVLDVASPVIKAPIVWETGFTGKGIGVAVIDTGIYPHDDLSGRIAAFQDLINGKSAPYDDNGHGTHVAGIVASDGRGSLNRYKGAAPAANVIGVKVLDRLGNGLMSTVISGVEWCIEKKDLYGIRVINLSLGSKASQSYKNDPVCIAVEKAWNSGLVVCVAAGNEGPEQRTISSPGIDPMVITVGAMDDKNTMDPVHYKVADYSSRGPTIDNINKPELLCPGTNLISLRSPGSVIDKQNKNLRAGSGYLSLSGTSMATPLCSGTVALMLEADRSLTPDTVKQKLLSSAVPLPGTPINAQGEGLTDAARSVARKADSVK